ncbi:hypothetical protein [Deinococcus sonorensis]|uniref:RelA/SpoT domain-containing protein n=1 Tax=Deinococcus sonorensis TaxID=309891 RepID=A0ABV8YBL2_9DEIO
MDNSQPQRVLALPASLLSISASLSDQYPTDPKDARQTQVDALKAHAEARTFHAVFGGLLQQLTQHTETAHHQRPGGIKSLERYVEKYLEYDLVPLDILAAKLVFPTLEAIYAGASHLGQVFSVAAFRDRFLKPRSSGYRDLQFVVNLGGHLAEVKLCHQLFDDLDVYEHKLFETRRSLQARPSLSEIETLVLDKLDGVSAQLFQEVWERALRREVDGDAVLPGR